MGLGISLLLVAAGAVLIWGVNASLAGVDLTTVGWILLVVGAVGGLLSMILWSRGEVRDERGERVIVDR